MNVRELVEVENKKNNDSLSLLAPLSCELLVSVKGNTNRKRKQERRKENTDRAQTKLNAPHVRCIM